MAEAAVGSALKWLGNLLAEEAKHLYGVEEKVEELQEELQWMKLFLKAVDAKQDSDARIREWIKQMSWLANRAEDIIKSFILKVEFQRQGRRGLVKKLKRYACIFREAKALHQVGCDVDALKLKISTLTSRLKTYGIEITKGGSNSSVRRASVPITSIDDVHKVQDENHIVGLDNVMTVGVLVDQLLTNDKANESRVVALCGIGGSGKTTLAWKVYLRKDVRQHFEAFAWAEISRPNETRRILARLLRGLTS